MSQPDVDEGYTRRALALTAFLLTGAALILSLLFFGPRGNYTVSVLSLLGTFIFGVLGIAAGGVRPPGRRAGMGISPYIFSMIAFALIGGLIGYGINSYSLAAIELPANSVTVQNADGFSPDAPATVIFNPPLPDKQYLGIKLRVNDYKAEGDCSTSPSAEIVPYQSNVQLPVVQVENLGTDSQEPSETQIEVRGATNDLRLQVRLRTVPGCVLRLEVAEAVFYD